MLAFPWQTLLAVAMFALALGLIVGLTAVGTGLIGAPGLIVLGLDSELAVGTIGVAGIFLMLASVLRHWQNGNVRLRSALYFCITAMPASLALALFKQRLNQLLPLTAIIAGVIILSVLALAYQFFFRRQQQELASTKAEPLLKPLLLGLGLGAINGATSISGSLILIAFITVLRMPEGLAIGTASLVAIFSLLAASAGHIAKGDVAWSLLPAFVPAVMIGAYSGARLSNIVPQKPLRLLILALLLLAGMTILWRTLAA